MYSSASATFIKEIEAVQVQSLRMCIGAFRTSPIPALQVKMGEMPLSVHTLKLTRAY